MDLDALKLEIRKYLNSQGVPDSLAVNILSAPVVTEGEPVAEYKKLFDIAAIDPNIPQVAELKIAGVKASSEYKDRDFAKYAIDGNPDTHFAAKGKGQSIIIDLGGKQEVSGLDVKWYEGHLRRMEYEIYKHIEHTDPNLQWVRLGSALSSGTANNEYENHVFDHPFVTDSIKIVGLGNSLNSFMSIVDLKVKGKQLAEPQEPCADPHAHKDGSGNCVCDEGYEMKDGQCVKSGGGPDVPPTEGTVLYDSEADFKANVGKTLKKETAIGALKVLWPSHAGGGDQGPDNHKVVEVDINGQKIIQKELNGDKVRDYLNNFEVDPEGKNFQIEVDDFTLSPDSKDLSIKFGNHSLDGYIFGGFGFSLHPNDWESKNEYNHAETTSSNDGDEKSGKLPKPIKFDGKTLYSLIVRCQTVAGKHEKQMTAAVKYPNESNFTELTDNMPRIWTDDNWLKGTDAKNKKEFDDDVKSQSKKPADADEVAAGVYLGPLKRTWVRHNGKSKVGKLFYRKAVLSKIGEAAA